MEDRRDENDEMSRWVWEAVEDKVDKAKIAKAEKERIEKKGI